MHNSALNDAPGAWERVDGWGQSASALCRVLRPESMDEVADAFRYARENELGVGLRGAGRSYGDASINAGRLLLDFTRLNAVHEWDKEQGLIRVDPGATVRDLWQRMIPDGWWPKVVSGTMEPTVGGALAMNIHGKNAYKVGTIGQNTESFRLLTPAGDDWLCTRDENADLFHAAIAGFGVLGVIHDVTLRAQHVGAGRVTEIPLTYDTFDGVFDGFEEELAKGVDYCVGWIDAFGTGRQLGRGQIHSANYRSVDEDPRSVDLLSVEGQSLPDTLMGVPKRLMWRFIKPFANPLGMRMINLAKVLAGKYAPGSKDPYAQTHAGFHFLLDFVPDWKRIYEPGGLIQFQPFVPHDAARKVFPELLRMQHERGLVNWLTVLKRHQPDPFLMTHGLDGWSMAQDFPVTDRNRGDLWRLCQDMAEVVVDHGGRFYPAKDSTLNPRHFQAGLGEDTVKQFLDLKDRVDPEGMLQTNLYRRLFPEHASGGR